MALPEITVFDMGGTITAEGASPEQTAAYQPGKRSVDALIRDMPGLNKIARLRVVNITNVGSPDITPNHVLGLAQKIQEELKKRDIQGVIVTHGTDTIINTAFTLEVTIDSEKPIVVVGAMLPATAYSADGPMNFLCSVMLVASKLGRKRGVVIVIEGKISRPRFTIKTGTSSPAFETIGPGHLGDFYDGQPKFYCEPCIPIGHCYFDITNIDITSKLPIVEILFFYPDISAELCRAVFKGGTQGVILAGAGSGCWSTNAGKVIAAEARARNILVVVSRQPQRGFIGSRDIYGLEERDSYIRGGFLSPWHCRVLLQLAIKLEFGFHETRNVFEKNQS